MPCDRQTRPARSIGAPPRSFPLNLGRGTQWMAAAAAAAYPTHPRLPPWKLGLGSVRRTSVLSGEGGGPRPRPGGRTPILMQRMRRKEEGRAKGFSSRHYYATTESGEAREEETKWKRRERGVPRTMQRFFYDERTNGAKGEEDDRRFSESEGAEP